MKHKAFILLAGIFLSACIKLPKKPDYKKHDVVVDTQTSDRFRIFYFPEKKKTAVKSKGVILVAADSYIQGVFGQALTELYARKEYQADEVSVERFVWWKFFKKFRKVYRQAVVIMPSQEERLADAKAQEQGRDFDSTITRNVGLGSVRQAFDHMESSDQVESYDVYFLTHGDIEVLSDGRMTKTSNGEKAAVGFLTTDIVENWAAEKKTEKLDLVFMQSCFGDSFIESWHRYGAKQVMGFEGLNQNFLYVSLFVDEYMGDNAREVHQRLDQQEMIERIDHNGLYENMVYYLAPLFDMKPSEHEQGMKLDKQEMLRRFTEDKRPFLSGR